MTTSQRCVELLEVKLTELDKVRAGSRLADLCAKKDAAVAAKQSAMSHHAAAIKEIDEAIQQATGVLIRGYERRPVECEWRLHEPREGYKTLYRLDLGEPVTVEEMSWAERQGSLFPEVNAWPQPNEHGVYDDDQAETLKPDKLPKGAKAEIRVLQIGPEEWISAVEVRTANSGWSWPLSRFNSGAPMAQCREAVIARTADALTEEVQDHLRISTSKADRAQLLAIGTWARSLVEELDQATPANGLAEEFGALDETAAETARQAVAAAEQHRGKAAGAADWQ
jgi:hypothetical protein